MSYIVVYQREDGSSGVEECADLDLAVVSAERLRNVDAVERPRIFKTEEITYDFKPYYRVEVTSAEAAAAVPAAPEVDAAVTTEPAVEAAEVTAPEAPPVPEDAQAPSEPAVDDVPSSDDVETEIGEPASVKKGLFSESAPEPPQEFPAVTPSEEDVTDPVPPRRGLFGR